MSLNKIIPTARDNHVYKVLTSGVEDVHFLIGQWPMEFIDKKHNDMNRKSCSYFKTVSNLTTYNLIVYSSQKSRNEHYHLHRSLLRDRRLGLKFREWIDDKCIVYLVVDYDETDATDIDEVYAPTLEEVSKSVKRLWRRVTELEDFIKTNKKEKE